MSDTKPSGRDDINKQPKSDEASASASHEPTRERSIHPEMSMQDAFAEVLRKMKAGIKMDLRDPKEK